MSDQSVQAAASTLHDHVQELVLSGRIDEEMAAELSSQINNLKLTLEGFYDQ